MKAWIQRVMKASVTVDEKVVSSIDKGYMVLLGVTHTDTEAEAKKIADKICDIRLFEDEKGQINRSIEDVDGDILVVSQFTLYADTSHGRRPGFSAAAPRKVAEPLYEKVVRLIAARLGEKRVKTGVFGADMKVMLINDGPVSVEICA
ncbi:MAG: D-tyrosyl-tRNA(Tyr) deacylase [Kiritimatiellae bacterium]|nr:D-tyrosyl-tRNA(Tyr) deacylase [Kiritimatiellia bacterium]